MTNKTVSIVTGTYTTPISFPGNQGLQSREKTSG